jgi:membrane protein implicated in regulation of membrane protease activity
MDQIVKLVWLALLIIFAAAEGITVGLTSVWFAAGSLCALIVALLGGPLWLQIALFIVVSALCLLAVRPLAKKYLTPGIQPTNADRIIGQEALVTEDIDDLQGKGAVTIGGVAWTARSGTDQPIPAGTRVRILRIEGVKVFVETAKEEVKCS